MTTREKLAAVLEALHKSGTHAARPLALDALEAIVQEARDSAIEEAALLLEGTHRRDGKNCEDRHAEILNAQSVTSADSYGSVCGNCTRAAYIRALKKAKP